MRERIEFEKGTTRTLTIAVAFYFMGRWGERIGASMTADAFFFTGMFLLGVFYAWVFKIK